MKRTERLMIFGANRRLANGKSSMLQEKKNGRRMHVPIKENR